MDENFIYCNTVNGHFIGKILFECKSKSYYIVEKSNGSKLDIPFSLTEELGNAVDDNSKHKIKMLLSHIAIDMLKTKPYGNREENNFNSERQKDIFNRLQKGRQRKYCRLEDRLIGIKYDLKCFNIYPNNLEKFNYGLSEDILNEINL